MIDRMRLGGTFMRHVAVYAVDADTAKHSTTCAVLAEVHLPLTIRTQTPAAAFAGNRTSILIMPLVPGMVSGCPLHV